MKPLEAVLTEMVAKPMVQEIAQEFDTLVQELGAIDPTKGSLETVALVLIALHREHAMLVPTEWWMPE